MKYDIHEVVKNQYIITRQHDVSAISRRLLFIKCYMYKNHICNTIYLQSRKCKEKKNNPSHRQFKHYTLIYCTFVKLNMMTLRKKNTVQTVVKICNKDGDNGKSVCKIV